jgi:hypothetical protein
MHDVTGATIFQLAIAGPSDLVADLTAAQGRFDFFRVAAIALGLLVLVGFATAPWLGILLSAAALAAGFYVYQWNKARRSVVAYYEVNDETAGAYQVLVDACTALRTSQRSWQIAEAGAVRTTYRYKVSAGASQLIKTVPLAVRHGGPPVLITNISVPSLVTRRRAIFLLPDRAVIREGAIYADVPYSKLRVEFTYSRYIESGRAPRDAEVVDHTWRFVNVKGGPDRRFNNNARLAVTRLAQISLSTDGGLQSILQFSRQDVAYSFAGAVHHLAEVTARLPLQAPNSASMSA